MTERPYELVHSPAGPWLGSGSAAARSCRHPLLNRGTAFTPMRGRRWATTTKLFPNAMLHWEDFGVTHAANPYKYADQMCTFNDDMQGGGCAGRRVRGSAGRGQPDARPASGHPRRWYGRDRYRGARGVSPRG